jgi:hypothetical protein
MKLLNFLFAFLALFMFISTVYAKDKCNKCSPNGKRACDGSNQVECQKGCWQTISTCPNGLKCMDGSSNVWCTDNVCKACENVYNTCRAPLVSLLPPSIIARSYILSTMSKLY